jgi:hypothetical protein
MSALSYVIDPGGDYARPGINIQVFPSGQEPLEQESIGAVTSRLSNNELAAGNFDFRYEFSFDCVLSLANYNKLDATIRLLQNRVNSLDQWEIVLYNFAQPFTEVSTERSRYLAPGTSVITQEDLGGGFYFWEYWVAIQGSLSITSKQRKGGCYEVTLEFVEGTLLTSAMEP